MTAPSFIQENNQENICKYCEQFILGQCRNTIHFQCEGIFCEEANEMYYGDYPEEAGRMPEFIYKPSIDVIVMEEKLDNRLKLMEEHNILSGLMLLRSGFFWGDYEIGFTIEILRKNLYKNIKKVILKMVDLRCEIMQAGGSVEDIFNYPEMKANFKIQSELEILLEDKRKDI